MDLLLIVKALLTALTAKWEKDKAIAGWEKLYQCNKRIDSLDEQIFAIRHLPDESDRLELLQSKLREAQTDLKILRKELHCHSSKHTDND